MSYNDSYADKTLSTSNASGDINKLSGLKYGDVFIEGHTDDKGKFFEEPTSAKTEISSDCEDIKCYVKCSCNTTKGWSSAKPASGTYYTVTDKRYASGTTCHKAANCDDFGYFASCPTGKTCTTVKPFGNLVCYKDPICYFTSSTSTSCPSGYSTSTTSCSSGYTLQKVDGTTTTTYSSAASDCSKASTTTTASNACGKCQASCPPGYFKEKLSNIYKYSEKEGCYKPTGCLENGLISSEKVTECSSICPEPDELEDPYDQGITCYINWPTDLVFRIIEDIQLVNGTHYAHKFKSDKSFIYWRRGYNIWDSPALDHDKKYIVKVADTRNYFYLDSVKGETGELISFYGIYNASRFSGNWCPTDSLSTYGYVDGTSYLLTRGLDRYKFGADFEQKVDNYVTPRDDLGFECAGGCPSVFINDGSQSKVYDAILGGDKSKVCVEHAGGKICKEYGLNIVVGANKCGEKDIVGYE